MNRATACWVQYPECEGGGFQIKNLVRMFWRLRKLSVLTHTHKKQAPVVVVILPWDRLSSFLYFVGSVEFWVVSYLLFVF